MQSRVTGIQKAKYRLYANKKLIGRHEFYAWANNNQDFKRLWDEWLKGKFDRKLTPTVDRINSDLGYILSNMRWITHSENSRLGALSKKRQYENKNHK
jgi:hypothetical protein